MSKVDMVNSVSAEVFAAAYELALEDARTMRLRFEAETLHRRGVSAARITRAWRSDLTDADHVEASEWWQGWLPETGGDAAARCGASGRRGAHRPRMRPRPKEAPDTAPLLHQPDAV